MFLETITNLLVFLLILSVLVLIHELGHFLVAKKLGIKVEEFGFGFPPRAFGIKRGETIYSINWFPIGGFVKLYGEDEAGAGKVKLKVESSKLKIKDEGRAFFARPVGQRALIVVAGVVMNALLAIVIFYAYLFIANFKAEIPLIGNYNFFLVNQKVSSDIVINQVAKDSPAQKAKIKAPAKIISINGQKADDVADFVDVINKNKGKEVTLIWQDAASKNYTAVLIPRVNPPKNQGALGISFFPVSKAILSYDTPLQKTFSGIVHPVNLMAYNFDVLKKLITVSIREKSAAPLGEGVSGPVGIYSIVSAIVHIPDAKERVLQGLNLAGILSISLAFFNVLPIPALDGGRLFFILIEGVIGKKVPLKYESFAHAVGMAILMTLIVLITFKDIARIFR